MQLYLSRLKPCAMCAGAIVQARIGRVVFGASDPKSRAYGSIDDFLAEPHFNHLIDVQGGILASECETILQTFFKQLREKRCCFVPREDDTRWYEKKLKKISCDGKKKWVNDAFYLRTYSARVRNSLANIPRKILGWDILNQK